ncbi:ABC transporter ATP-binding protein [Lentisphaerota bacterium WC36G]|nr:ABC transporter ATP-binding protein [Lentisphaerae bacterium WC36]
MKNKLLEVENLAINIVIDNKDITVVNDLSFSVRPGEVVSLVGESGCGKSLSCLAIARLHQEPLVSYKNGTIMLYNQEHKRKYAVLDLNRSKLNEIRGGLVSYIFQEPTVSLNPVFRIGDQIAEAILLHRKDVIDINSEVIKLLQDVGIPAPEKRIKAYPHELSGGMQQRIMIAMALASRPKLLIADEPTTALDVTIQAQILELLYKLKDKYQMGILLVTHNLGIVSELADKVIVMYAGSAVEKGTVEEVIYNPAHPYTKALLKAVPVLGGKVDSLQTIRGSVPSVGNYPTGCRFYGRCSLADSLTVEELQKCQDKFPKEYEVNNDAKHCCRCHYI